MLEETLKTEKTPAHLVELSKQKMHFRKLLRVQRKRFAFCQLAAAATNETSSSQQHQLRPRCDPLLPPPPPCSYSPPFAFRNKNYGNRCVATCRAAACDMVHTRVTLQLSRCLSLAFFPSPSPAAHLMWKFMFIFIYAQLGPCRR